ncbi:MAG: PLD nuclease N-terminal domain-containing protein [Candidatus Nanopelagicales bacterium]|nr:PLD nuclease N-terminal domain-containing protein [Candidatus Nanopelagicales bacterium]
MATRKQWSDYSRNQQRLIIAAGAVEAVLTTIALVDLARRPKEQIRGSRALWLLGVWVQPVGPIAYLTMGRRRPE